MSTLNPDILEEILPHLSHVYSKSKEDNEKNIENLKKFMSSGKEPFYAALRYFSHTTHVIVCQSHLFIQVKRFPLKKSAGTNLHKIPYEFEFLDAILNVLPKTFLSLDYPDSVKGKRAVAILVHFKKFNSLFFGTHKLPQEYIEFFKTDCVFDELELMDCNGNNPSLIDFFEMDAKQYCIDTSLPEAGFNQQCQNLLLFQTFPKVKDLTLEDTFSIDAFNFTMNGIKRLLLIFRDCFPNLLTLKICFQRVGAWQDAYLEMVKMQPQEFRNCVSPQLKGSINLLFDGDAESYVNYEPDVEDTVYIKQTNEFGDIVCEFEIQDGLNFKFKIDVFDEDDD